jgi:cytochrome b561
MTTIKIRPAGYSGIQKMIHWVMALIAIVLIPIGFYMVQRGTATNFDAVTNDLYTKHKTFGAIMLVLILLRVFIRVRTGSPAPEPSLNRLQIIMAEAVHGLLYLLLLCVPLLGWLGVSAYGARGIAGGFNLPEILAKNEPLGEILLRYHGYAAVLLMLFIGAHIGAALMHRLVLKDGVLKRMLP